ncbi:MAG TPA: hypothetical protein PKZ83_17960 [bacterium]|nr:hypothetical protein [bacterium]
MPVWIGMMVPVADEYREQLTPVVIEFKAVTAGAAGITISDLLATRYREDVSIEQYSTESIPASLEVVMSEPSGKVVVRVEIV